MNEYDSGLVKQILEVSGYRCVEEPEEADLIFLNTCAVREKAHERVLGRVESLRHLKRKKPGLLFGILGCMAQNLGQTLFRDSSAIDLVVGPDNYRDLPQMIDHCQAQLGEHLARTILSSSETYDEYRPSVVNGVLAYVTIMRGCDNFCSFCVVPYTRGRERSRPPVSLIDEILRLENAGIKEITLLGQNVNSYKFLDTDFAELMRSILRETGIPRIRFTSPHPHDFPDSLLSLMATENRLANHIHLPLQSGSSSVLKRMKRDYTREEFIELVGKIRLQIADVAISTDIITGFCGESQAEHEETLSLMEQLQFDMAYMFQYSERRGTIAQKKYPDDVPDSVKGARLEEIITLQNRISKDLNQKRVGMQHRVLVEGLSKRSSSQWSGRDSRNRTVIINPGSATLLPRPGEFVDVRIISSSSATLIGELVSV